MNVKKMAQKDALRCLTAAHLNDEIANKFERLTGYGEAFDKAYSKVFNDAYPKHIKTMNKLRDRLDKASKPSHVKGLLLLTVATGAFLYVRPDKKFVIWLQGVQAEAATIAEARARQEARVEQQAKNVEIYNEHIKNPILTLDQTGSNLDAGE